MAFLLKWLNCPNWHNRPTLQNCAALQESVWVQHLFTYFFTREIVCVPFVHQICCAHLCSPGGGCMFTTLLYLSIAECFRARGWDLGGGFNGVGSGMMERRLPATLGNPFFRRALLTPFVAGFSILPIITALPSAISFVTVLTIL